MKADLDELEVAIHLINSDNPTISYRKMKELVESIFGFTNSIQDYYLIFEPTIEEESIDNQLMYQNLNLV